VPPPPLYGGHWRLGRTTNLQVHISGGYRSRSGYGYGYGYGKKYMEVMQITTGGTARYDQSGCYLVVISSNVWQLTGPPAIAAQNQLRSQQLLDNS
jgi:hypothetical protein